MRSTELPLPGLVGWNATDDEYAHLVESLAKFAEHELATGSADVSPYLAMLVREEPYDSRVETGIELVSFALVDWNDPKQRYDAVRGIGRDVYRRKVMPAAIAIVSSCWQSKCRAEDAANRPQPKDDPNRVEAVNVFAMRIGRPDVGITISVAELDRSESQPFLRGWSSHCGLKASRSPLLETFLEGFLEEVARKMTKGANHAC